MLLSNLIRSKKRRRGAVAVVVTICLIPLIGVMAFAFDGGMMLAARRRAQTVADAASYSTACQLSANLTTDPTGLDVSGKARTVAFANAKANGFSNDGTTSTVTVNIPPLSGDNIGEAGYAEVIVVAIQKRTFSAIFGSGTLNISARSVSRINLASPPSILLLEPTASQALTLAGGSTLTTQSIIQANTTSSSGTQLSGASTLTAAGLHLTGNGFRDTSSTVKLTKESSVKTGTAATPDPLASLATPTTAGLTNQSFTSTYGSKTISPGVYSGGISIGGGMTITMQPGIYYMKGGGLSIANGATVRGTGVTIFMDNTNGGGQFSIAGGTTVSLTPPTTGTYAGLTYFQDRSNSKSLSFNNGASINLSGTIYAANAAVNLSGGTSNTYGSQIIADTMAISNGTNLKVNTTDDAKLGYVAAGASSSASIATVE